jgi:hypothetical protein
VSTRIYGASDDLIEFDGDVYGEVGHFGTDEREKGDLIMCSDGSILEVKYGKADLGIWGLVLIQAGSLFDRIEPCSDENAKVHSDIAHFKDGLKWAYVATEWERVK